MANEKQGTNLNVGAIEKRRKEQSTELRNTRNRKINGEQGSTDKVGQMNESRRQAEIEEEEKKKKEKEDKEKAETKPNAISSMTSGLLKAAWENLVMSWGLTLIWIDIHIFSALVFGNKLFCKLGMEWVPEGLKRAQFKEAEKLGKVVGATEGIGVAALNLGCLMIVIAALMIAAMMVDVIQNPISNFARIIGWVWDKISSVVPYK